MESKRRDYDTYLTPDWCIQRLIENFEFECILSNYNINRIMDPCAADGNLLKVIKDFYRGGRRDWQFPIEYEALEIRDTSKNLEAVTKSFAIADFLETPISYEDERMIITNPPYSLAREFIEKSMSISSVSVFLLRMSFLGSIDRSSWLRKLNPDLFILPNRPSFTGEGSDNSEYAWYIFYSDKDIDRRYGSYRILKETSREELRAWKDKVKLLEVQ